MVDWALKNNYLYLYRSAATAVDGARRLDASLSTDAYRSAATAVDGARRLDASLSTDAYRSAATAVDEARRLDAGPAPVKEEGEEETSGVGDGACDEFATWASLVVGVVDRTVGCPLPYLYTLPYMGLVCSSKSEEKDNGLAVHFLAFEPYEYMKKKMPRVKRRTCMHAYT